MKTGNVIAFVGSSAGATFFPDRVTTEDENSYPIEIKTLPAPQFEGGERDTPCSRVREWLFSRSQMTEVEASVRLPQVVHAERLVYRILRRFELHARDRRI